MGFNLINNMLMFGGNNNLMIRHRQEARVLVLRPASVAEEKFLSARSMMSALAASGRWYGTPLDLDLICSLSEEPHLVRAFHLLLCMNG